MLLFSLDAAATLLHSFTSPNAHDYEDYTTPFWFYATVRDYAHILNHVHGKLFQLLLTSWMSSPSRKRTGFRASRWSIRNVFGSFKARTMHLDKYGETCVCVCGINTEDENTDRCGHNIPVGIYPSLRSIVFCVTAQQLHHDLGCRFTVENKAQNVKIQIQSKHILRSLTKHISWLTHYLIKTFN